MVIDYAALERRLGRDLLRKRLLKQAHQEATETPQRKYIIDIQRFEKLIGLGLKLVGIYHLGRRNALSMEVIYNEIFIKNLPEAFDGYKLLQLTDLHADVDRVLSPKIIKAVQGLNYDLCVITGDFRSKTFEAYHVAIEETLEICKAITAPIYAVLGNHDFIEIVPHLEAAGIQFLLNETTYIDHGGARILLAGIDDPNYYQTHSISKVAQDLQPEMCSILLSHSPETFAQAEAAGFSALLAGHTHGGQICLPGGIPIVNNSNGCSREKIAGPWRHHNLEGYTSRGTGCCGIPVRLNCPPEITLHTLRTKHN
ncbi:MAG TPA: metallophosphoesterase [Opitutae bacterium]|nr:metallophosphoesterase [Opitutae bacterium]